MALKEALRQGYVPSPSEQQEENLDQSYAFTSRQQVYFIIKRGLDVILSLLFLVILSPIFLVCTLAVKLESSGPAIFRQERMGRGGNPFRVYKFRTMYTHTPNNVATSQFKGVDHYITRVGKFFRATSLDELPQLVNVLKGEMSLVGPRPLILSEEEVHAQRWENGVYLLRPGVTGYAQVNGRDLVTEESKVILDTEYLHRFSLWLDLKILFKTVAVVFLRKDYQEGCVNESQVVVEQEKSGDAHAA